jgi:hypothetical protein
MRDGLSALRMAVLCPFCRSSMCRYVHCELTRNEVLDLGLSQNRSRSLLAG